MLVPSPIPGAVVHGLSHARSLTRCLPEDGRLDFLVMHPYSLSTKIWDLVPMAFVVYTVVTLPLNLAFDYMSPPMFVLNLICDAVFICDTVTGFFHGFKGSGGVLQHRIERLARLALFSDEFDVAVEDVVFLALDDFEVAGGVAGRRFEFHGFVYHEEFKEPRTWHHNGVLAAFFERFALEGDGS